MSFFTMNESDSSESVEDEQLLNVPDDSMFTAPGSMSDVTLLVEGRVLHVSRCVLSLASPVFRKMLEGEFKVKGEITIVDKKYNDMVELLLCIYPSTSKKVTRETWETVLPLADEYEIESIKTQCEKLLVDQLQFDERYKAPSTEELAHFLFIANKYKLEQMFSLCIEKTSTVKFDGKEGLKSMADFNSMSAEAKYLVTSAKLTVLEEPVNSLFLYLEKNKWVLDFLSQPSCASCFYRKQAEHEMRQGCYLSVQPELMTLSRYLKEIMNMKK